MRLIFSLPGNEAFANRLAEAGGWKTGSLESRRFPDGESYIRILSDVDKASVDFVCTLAQPDDRFLRLAFAADAARSLGAREVTLIAPYLPYMRQDRRFKPGEALSSKTFARFLSSFDRLITVDPHLHRYPTLSAVYTISTNTLHTAPLLADWIAAEIQKPLIIGPDEESEQWVSAIAARVGAPYVVLTKIRHGDRSVDVTLPDLSPWRNHQPVLVDDIASSGLTLIEAARKIPIQGLRRPVCVVVHGIFADDSYERLQALAERVVSTDSVPHETNAIRLAPLIAGSIISGSAASEVLARHRRQPEPQDQARAAGLESTPASNPPPLAKDARS